MVPVMGDQLKAIHDRLLAEKPDGAEHDPATCLLCAMDLEPEPKHPIDKGAPTMGELSQTDLEKLAADAAAAGVAAAKQVKCPTCGSMVDPEDLKDHGKDEATEKAKADLEASLADLQAKLDEATAAKTKAEADLADTLAYLAKEEEDKQAAAALAAKKDERTAEAKAAKVFPDEYVEEQADRFAAMSDEDWADRKAEWALLAKAEEEGEKKKPESTAFQASRTGDPNQPKSNLHLIGEMRRQGQDARTA